MRICRKSKTALHACKPNRSRDASPQAEWRIANRIAAAAAIMINTAKKIPGFIEVSVHCALGGYMKKPRRSGAFVAPTLELFRRLSADALAAGARLVDAAAVHPRP
jgi:hypothetical protein